MSSPRTTMSATGMRLRARAPRAAFYLVVGVLVLAGLRAVLEPAAEPVAAPRVEHHEADLGAQSFAEAFARAYLSWDASDTEARERHLAAFLASGLDADGGLVLDDRADQQVLWTTVAGASTRGDHTNVTVSAETSSGSVNLSVPVERDPRGFLYVSAYPALVGPPAVNRRPAAVDEDEVDDPKLERVVTRALTNYLARARSNLLADLTPDAVVSLPVDSLDVTGVDAVTWAQAGRRVGVELDAEDEQDNSWTLRYELEVQKTDRWYVRSLQVDPTFQGGGR
jgi:hypothetical protein